MDFASSLPCSTRSRNPTKSNDPKFLRANVAWDVLAFPNAVFILYTFLAPLLPLFCSAVPYNLRSIPNAGGVTGSVWRTSKKQQLSEASRMVENVAKNLLRGCGRIFPDCVILGQAIAFNMFLAFFPMLLFALGLLSGTSFFQEAMREVPARLSLILPPESAQVVTDYFLVRGLHPQRWIFLGLGGTLIAGSQVMVGFIEGFRMIEGDPIGLRYWRRHLRALALLCLTIVPVIAVVALTVFGRPMRGWLAHFTGAPHQIVQQVFFVAYGCVVFLLAMAVLIALYRIGRPGHSGIVELIPGAAIATLLWWATDIVFGYYVRRVPYGVIYGGLAAAIGLLLWMYLAAIIVLLGAAYNAEARDARLSEKSILMHQLIIRDR